MHLNELAIGVVNPLLIKRRLRRSGAHYGICRLAKDCAVAASRNNDCVGRESSHFHRPQVHGANAATDVAVIKHRGKKFPVLEFLHLALLNSWRGLARREHKAILLSGRGSGKGRAVVQRFRRIAGNRADLRAVRLKGTPITIEQVDDAGAASHMSFTGG